MKTEMLWRLKLVVIVLIAIGLVPGPGIQGGLSTGAIAASQEDETTQDIIHMRDGRELTGKILSEDPTTIRFRYVDANLNLSTTITLNKRDILEIERDVPVEGAAGDRDDQADIPDDDGAPVQRSRPSDLQRGLAEGDVHDETLPAFYVIPMRGQMGTDIHPDVYRRIIDDIRAEQPELVVWLLECADRDELMITQSEAAEQGLPMMIEDYRELVRMLHDDLRGIRQVMWVHDSFGISSLMALAWQEMYMTPNARLSGFRAIYEMAARQGDEDVAAKMVAAWIAIINGFLERGGRAIELGEAMSRPHHRLSATWRGREVVWRLDTRGEYIVNDSDERTVSFRAKDAEDFGVSSGTAETLDDLALLLGYREYRVIEGAAQHTIERYVANWRRTLDNAKTWWEDHHRHRRWATGDETLRWLSRARNDLTNIIRAMNRYPAVETRFTMEVGVNRFQLEIMEEQLREQIRALRAGERRGGGGGRGGPMGGPMGR